jgi:hypothetical protein
MNTRAKSKAQGGTNLRNRIVTNTNHTSLSQVEDNQKKDHKRQKAVSTASNPKKLSTTSKNPRNRNKPPPAPLPTSSKPLSPEQPLAVSSPPQASAHRDKFPQPENPLHTSTSTQDMSQVEILLPPVNSATSDHDVEENFTPPQPEVPLSLVEPAVSPGDSALSHEVENFTPPQLKEVLSSLVEKAIPHEDDDDSTSPRAIKPQFGDEPSVVEPTISHEDDDNLSVEQASPVPRQQALPPSRQLQLTTARQGETDSIPRLGK